MPQASDEAHWVQLDTGAAIKVRPLKSPTALRRFQRLPKSVQRAAFGGARAWTDRTWRAFCEYLAEAVLVDWEGIRVDGQPVEFDQATAAEVLRHNYAFNRMVLEAASGKLESV